MYKFLTTLGVQVPPYTKKFAKTVVFSEKMSLIKTQQYPHKEHSMRIFSFNLIRSMALCVIVISATITPHLAWAQKQTVKAEVMTVIDGTTLFVKSVETGKEYTVKLYGIACVPMPTSRYENPAPFAQMAKDMTEKLVGMSKNISITKLDDRYNPTVGIVHFPELNITLQNQLLSSGLAWVDNKACSDWGTCKSFKNIQENAKFYGNNVWSATPPVVPGE